MKPLWFILDSLVLIFLPAMTLCCSGTNITYPRSRVVRPWGLEILYCVSDQSILVLNYAHCVHRNWSHGWWWERSWLPTLVYCCTRWKQNSLATARKKSQVHWKDRSSSWEMWDTTMHGTFFFSLSTHIHKQFKFHSVHICNLRLGLTNEIWRQYKCPII